MNAIATIEIDTNELTEFNQYLEAGRQLSHMGRQIGFMIGDWVNHGKQYFGEQMDLALDAAQIDPRFARKAAAIAEMFPAPRRSEALSFEHHKAVANLPSDDALQLLSKAEKEGWKVPDIREAATQKRYESGALFDDEDVDYHLALQIIRAWNRATTHARKQFMELAEKADTNTIDEDKVYAD